MPIRHTITKTTITITLNKIISRSMSTVNQKCNRTSGTFEENPSKNLVTVKILAVN